MKKTVKTNAMRILDQAKITYHIRTYPMNEAHRDYGLSIAAQLNEDPRRVFKTLITQAPSHHIYVFVIPVGCTLNNKRSAKLVKEKSLDLVPVKELFSLSGYVRGGCSPIGMKKSYPTILHESALAYDSIWISGGKIGVQLEINPQALMTLIRAQSGDVADIINP